jgi:membrane protein YqaA with SNARE-associated domain
MLLMKPSDETREPMAGDGRSRAWLVLRFVLGMIALLAVVVLVVRALRPELESVGRAFVERFGLTGVLLGTFLADGFHCPIPPQFYMLLAIAAGRSPLAILAASIPGSLLGGACGFLLARRLAKIPKFASWLTRVSGKWGRQLGQDYAHRSVLMASFTPIAFSMLCYLAGMYRVRRSAFLLMLALRVPKLVVYYYLVSAGWNGP